MTCEQRLQVTCGQRLQVPSPLLRGRLWRQSYGPSEGMAVVPAMRPL